MSLQEMYQATLAQVEAVLADPALSTGQKYGRITDLMLFSRVDFLRQRLLGELGPVVQSGPFAGMRFHESATEGCYIPKLLGCYEEELHPVIEALSRVHYDRIINVGCAEGFYAVGLARCIPNAEILAFDINEKARQQCLKLAEMNDVAHRFTLGGRLEPHHWGDLIQGRTLIICDCEGAEYDLLDPAQGGESLFKADFLIELHDTAQAPERARKLLQAYEATHHLELVNHGGRNPSGFPSLRGHKHLDQLLSVWEFRGGPTPWAVLRALLG